MNRNRRRGIQNGYLFLPPAPPPPPPPPLLPPLSLPFFPPPLPSLFASLSFSPSSSSLPLSPPPPLPLPPFLLLAGPCPPLLPFGPSPPVLLSPPSPVSGPGGGAFPGGRGAFLGGGGGAGPPLPGWAPAPPRGGSVPLVGKTIQCYTEHEFDAKSAAGSEKQPGFVSIRGHGAAGNSGQNGEKKMTREEFEQLCRSRCHFIGWRNRIKSDKSGNAKRSQYRALGSGAP